ncbi:MAG: BCCT family transporter [Desulfocurvibacter africanus]
MRPDFRIIIPVTLALLAIIIPSIAFTEQFEKVLSAVYKVFADSTGTFYLWATFAMICMSVYFTFSKHSRIKFGESGEKPEFNNFSWIAMMFCSGVAGAVMFWSVVEPLWNLVTPPQYAPPMSTEAYEWSLTYVLFHWGPVTWPWYVITALPICHMYYTRRKPVLRISSAAEPLLGDKVNGAVGLFLEVFFIIGLLFSNAAVMGISLPIVNHALAATFGLTPSFGMQMGVLAVSSAIFTFSVCSGLKRGIKVLSDINVVIALAMIAFALVTGPTTYIVNTFTNSVGKMANEMMRMLFWTDPYTGGSFPKDWTIFYALWMASYGPFMGLFIARISKGRTVREIIVMGVLGGMAGSFLIHGVFGSYTLYVQSQGIVDAVGILKSSGGPTAMVAVLKSLPMGAVILIGYCIFSTIFLATSVDSCAYIISCSATRKMAPGFEPWWQHRLFWAVLQTGLALGVICLGGLGPIKVFANFAGALMLFPIAFAVLSWFKVLRGDRLPVSEPKQVKADSPAQVVPVVE